MNRISELTLLHMDVRMSRAQDAQERPPLPPGEGWGEGKRAEPAASASRSALTRAFVRAGGFTIIEILVVVVILGILAGLLVPRIMDAPDKARVVEAKTNISTIVGALKMYKLDNGVYPSPDQGLQALVQKPQTGEIPRNWKSGGYLDRLPQDPWKHDYQYLNPGIRGDVDVVSLGADGQPGGEGLNADIGYGDN
jgi:general secretion pathway protein G